MPIKENYILDTAIPKTFPHEDAYTLLRYSLNRSDLSNYQVGLIDRLLFAVKGYTISEVIAKIEG